MQTHMAWRFEIRILQKWTDGMEWVSVWWFQVIETVHGDALELCKFFRNSLSLFPGLGAHRPQQSQLFIFSYSIVTYLDLKNQISRGNSWLRHLNKLQITAFQGKCACFAVLGLYLWFRVTFIFLTLITVTCSTYSQGLSSASLIVLCLRRKNIHFSS